MPRLDVHIDGVDVDDVVAAGGAGFTTDDSDVLASLKALTSVEPR